MSWSSFKGLNVVKKTKIYCKKSVIKLHCRSQFLSDLSHFNILVTPTAHTYDCVFGNKIHLILFVYSDNPFEYIRYIHWLVGGFYFLLVKLYFFSETGNYMYPHFYPTVVLYSFFWLSFFFWVNIICRKSRKRFSRFGYFRRRYCLEYNVFDRIKF